MFDHTLALACTDAAAQYFGLFDISVAPPLLFYAYIPVVILALAMGVFTFSRAPHARPNQLLFALSLTFSIFIINEIMLWVSVPAALVHFGWALSLLLLAYIHFFAFYFAYSFTYERHLHPALLSIAVLLLLPIIVLLPSHLNVSVFDLDSCEGVTGPLWYYYYFVSAATIFSLIAISISQTVLYKRERTSQSLQSIYLLIGTAVFLAIFSASYAFGELTGAFEVNLVGPVGMILFLGVLSYLVVAFKAMNVGLVGAQVLVFALIALVGSKFFVRSESETTITAMTFLLATMGGYLLIRSVKREIREKERNEMLAKDLAKANVRLRELDKLKSEFVSIASHQLRSPITAIRGYASMLLEGSFGSFPDKAQEALKRIDESSRFMALSINDFLNVSRIESGSMKYEKAIFSFSKLASSISDDLRPVAMKKGLVLVYRSDTDTDMHVSADEGKVRQVVQNVVDNAMKYTPKGTITIVAQEDAKAKKARVIVADTGVGMSEETAQNLFGKFVRAKNANSVNVYGTGLGLYIAKQMIEAMGGTLTAKSDGEGKGSTFTIELPLQT